VITHSEVSSTYWPRAEIEVITGVQFYSWKTMIVLEDMLISKIEGRSINIYLSYIARAHMTVPAKTLSQFKRHMDEV
jgi:hypothetical protein